MSVQYTIRCVPEAIDQALREEARSKSISINAVALEALARGLNLPGSDAAPLRDLSDLIGSWQEDPAFDEAIKEFDRIDPEQWT